jgi:Tol biopolymer transport system component
MGATGESVRRLIDVGYNPAWSPDGEEILYATEDTTDTPERRFTTSQLWTVNLASRDERLITDGDAVQPSWSPHGQWIAYWCVPVEGAQRDIWTMRADGGDAVPLTNDIYVDWNPIWSPGGEYLYFSSDRGGSMNLWRLPIEEETGHVLGEPEPVTTGGSASRFHPGLSRDGRRIVYVEHVQTLNLQKVAFDLSTETTVGQPAPITRGSRRANGPNPSPDGEWLAYYSWGEEQEDIYVVGTDGTDRRQLTDDVYKDRVPRWSPDGNRIAFYSDRSGTYRIWTIHPDGSGLEMLAEASGGANVWYPVWSPDASRMAYYSDSNRTSHICQIGKTSEEQTPEALPPLDEAGDAFEVWSWSPDGKWLAANVLTGAGPAGIAIYNLESRQYQRLTHSGGYPVWLSDSRRLLFADFGGIFIMDIESGNTREVLSVSPDRIFSLTVAADDRTVYFAQGTTEADIWMLTLNEERE